jgi:hypothetical protein
MIHAFVILKGCEMIAGHPERLNGKYKVHQPSSDLPFRQAKDLFITI